MREPVSCAVFGSQSGKMDGQKIEGGIMEKATIEMAILGLEEQKKKIEQAIVELRTQLNGRSRRPFLAGGGEMPTPFARKRRRMSAAAKRKISDAMKRRYAAMRAPAKK